MPWDIHQSNSPLDAAIKLDSQYIEAHARPVTVNYPKPGYAIMTWLRGIKRSYYMLNENFKRGPNRQTVQEVFNDILMEK